jgi:hypothetical protein
MMVAGALLLIPTLVTLLGTAVIGISPALILGVVLLAVGAMLRSRVGAGSPDDPPPRPDSTDDSERGA